MGKRILITGASGFVGRHLATLLLSKGMHVVGLDHRNVSDMPTGVEVIHGDLEDPASLAQLPKVWDGVVHLAALSVPSAFHSMEPVLRNVSMTLNLLSHLQSARVLLHSSSHVYAPSLETRKEDDPLRPHGLYGLSKHLTEQAARGFDGHLDIRIVRPFNLIGPGQRAELVIPSLLRHLRHLDPESREPVQMKGINSVRDFMDVRDMATACLAILEADDPPHKIFNACRGVPLGIAALVKHVLDLLGTPRETHFAGITLSTDDIPFLVGDPTRLQALGWRPRYSIEDSLRCMLELPSQIPITDPLPSKAAATFPDTFPLAKKRIWVTGGQGFLGRQVVQKLQNRGAEVLAPSSTELDLLHAADIQRFLSAHHPDGVVHLAARVGGIGANRAQPGTFFHHNMIMGTNIIEACRNAGVSKLLVTGTVCSYPKHCPVPFREDDLWHGYPEETNAPYGIAKKALMVMLQAYRQEFGLNGIFMIPVNLYGPGDHLDLASNHVIPALLKRFLLAKAEGAPCVELWGTGEPTREFLYVEDAAQGLCDAMARYEDAAPVNLGTGQEISIRHLAEKIRALVGYPGDIRFNPEYPDGQPRRRLDTTRAKSRFGWEATTSLDDGLLRTLTWMREALSL